MPKPLFFLADDGEMATLIRQKDWSQSPIGPPETWSQSFRTILGLLLRSRFPMFLFWGPELTFFYNDAFRASLGHTGKHPGCLGERGDVAWAERWPVLKPQFDQVLSGGGATWSEDQLIPVARDGRIDDTYWTLSYSPVDDDSGQINGVFGTCLETTQTVLSRLESENRKQELLTLIEEAPVAICILRGPTFVIEMANPLMYRLWRNSAEHLYGRPLFEGLPETAGAGYEELLMSVLAGETVTFSDLPFTLLEDGVLKTFYSSSVYQPVYEPDGRIERIMGMVHETTDSVRARQQIEESEQLLRDVFEQAPVSIAIFRGPELITEMTNAEANRIMGHTAEQMVGKPLMDVVPELKGQGFNHTFAQLLETGETLIGREVPLLFPHGDKPGLRYYHMVYRPLRSPARPEKRLLILGTDVTERVQARKVHEHNQTQLYNLLMQIPVAIVIYRGSDYVIELINDTHLKIWGRTREEVLNKPVFDALPELGELGYEAGYRAMLNRVFQTGETFYTHEAAVALNRTGKTEMVYFNYICQALREVDGTITGTIIVANEITEQVVARRKIEESAQHFRQLADLVPPLVWTALNDGEVDFFNQRWFDYTGQTPEQALGSGWFEVVHPDDKPRTSQVWAEAVAGSDLYNIEYRLRQHDGTYRWFLGRGIPIRDDSGAIVRWFGTTTDIHDQRSVHEQLEKLVAERTQSLQHANEELERSNLDLMQFASVASHDLKEPLRKVQTIGTRLEELLTDRLMPHEVDLFHRLINATARMQNLVSDVLRFSQLSDQTQGFDWVDLNQVLRDIRDDLELPIREQHANVTVTELPTVWAISGQMHQLFLNLIGNALKFQDKPSPLVSIDVLPVTCALMEALNLSSRHYVVISVRDNGIGFESKYNEKIFGMFQRLHGRSRYAGTGIGLTIVKKIVDNHKGCIDVQSEPGKGTTFRIALPVNVVPS